MFSKLADAMPHHTHPLVAELDEAHGLLEGVLRVAARVEDVRAQPDATEDVGVGVDLVQGVHHGLHPLKQHRMKLEENGGRTEDRILCKWGLSD